jgi:uncharacterized protein (DUF302 family)
MDYNFHVTTPGSLAGAVEKVKEALKADGFGVLTEIDVEATLKAKLGVDFPPYRILGACNPPLAKRALEAEPRIGVMLPCNVIVRQIGENQVEIAAINPAASIQPVGNPALTAIAEEVADRLRKVLESL